MPHRGRLDVRDAAPLTFNCQVVDRHVGAGAEYLFLPIPLRLRGATPLLARRRKTVRQRRPLHGGRALGGNHGQQAAAYSARNGAPARVQPASIHGAHRRRHRRRGRQLDRDSPGATSPTVSSSRASRSQFNVAVRPDWTQGWFGVVNEEKQIWKKYLPEGSEVTFSHPIQGGIVTNELIAKKTHDRSQRRRARA